MKALRAAMAVAGILLLAAVVFADDSVFAQPIQEPRTYTRVIHRPVATSALIFDMRYTAEVVTEKEANRTLYYPFNFDVEKISTKGWDPDDTYTMKHYDTSGLAACAQNATSIDDIYECTKSFNRGGGSCRTSTAAFKIAFMNSPLAAEKQGYKLAKAFIKDPTRPLNAHRFIVLSNGNGNYVIDPYWGAFENLTTSVKKNTALFYDNPTSKNYRGIVYKVDYFYNG